MWSTLFCLFLVLGLGSGASGPWVWQCDQSRKACDRVLQNEAHTPLDMMECKMTCSDEGLLWPLPKEYSLSKDLRYVGDVSGFQISQLDMDEASGMLLTRFFDEAFIGYLSSMSGTKSSNEKRQASPGFMSISITVTDAYENLTVNTDEAYTLLVSDAGDGVSLQIDIHAPTFYGARHGLETLSQLVTWNSDLGLFQVHASAQITDNPSYPHRGVMVDTSRNFMSVPILKKVLEGMAHNKLNIFHWHMTDSVSFPVQLPQVPELAEYGSYSPEKVYSVQDMTDLVDFAKVRGIKIIPELDTPRHAANGWQFGEITGLGKLGLCINLLNNRCRGGLCGHLNPVNPNLYDVLEKVYQDLTNIFPSDLFHMGGDEVEFQCWRDSPEVMDWMTDHGLTGTDQDMFNLWVQFQQNASLRLKTNNVNKKIILWTSSLTSLGNTSVVLPPEDYVIQIWTFSNDSTIADLINQGYPVIMSNSDALYLDCGFGNYVREGLSWCDPYKDWHKIYMNRPRQIYLSFANSDPNRVNQILGSETTAWTESISEDTLETRIWPRSAALAERLWSDPQESGWEEAEIRFVYHRQRMVDRGVKAEAVQPEWCLHFEHRCREIQEN